MRDPPTDLLAGGSLGSMAAPHWGNGLSRAPFRVRTVSRTILPGRPLGGRRYNPPTVMDQAAEEAQLMQRVVQRDRRAFLRLYDRYASKVYGLALRMLRDRMNAEEVTQDAFLRLWTRAETFKPGRGRLVSWLLTITRRLALDRFRLQSRRPRVVESANPAEDWYARADPRSKFEEARWSSLRFAVLDLPDEQRVAIELAYYHGLSHSQIAEQLQIPLGTVKTRIRLGMQKLREAWLGDRQPAARQAEADPNGDDQR